MRGQSVEHNEVIPNTGSDGDFLWLKAAVAVIEKDQLSSAGLKDRRRRHDELAPEVATSHRH